MDLAARVLVICVVGHVCAHTGCTFGVEDQFYAVSYASVNPDLVAHGRRFVEWLDRGEV